MRYNNCVLNDNSEKWTVVIQGEEFRRLDGLNFHERKGEVKHGMQGTGLGF